MASRSKTAAVANKVRRDFFVAMEAADAPETDDAGPDGDPANGDNAEEEEGEDEEGDEACALDGPAATAALDEASAEADSVELTAVAAT